ncbi:P-loop containing nucleoside triphosphate hydrolase protein [Schizophyllum commune H4-8]|nr:P-loop containing nucleoside triphosphate hydrolase protein [Schizophyllum commune H4-8]KAI5887210.1 P-loop containing nucleoside triphosphate hydrolase protein [Schizophyllum commune H4-8]
MLEAFGSYVRTVEKYYKELEIPDRDNVLADGQLSYPLPTSSSRGMHFKLRDVCFDYPGGSDQMALRGVNITILPGQLVVIVGVNGSGKSTLIKLLTRLYDPTSGTVSVDGERLSAYRQCTIRQATAVLSQAHRIFPMSMGENIGIGCVERVRDVDAVREAAEDGGASGCIFKLRHGFDTILEPQHRAYGEHISDEEDDPLRQRLGALDKSIQLSGGEKQRIAAARTFMRFKSGKIRAVFVDEPSSALDPEGELRLFDNLRKERQGKTMIFVTHRFGHLTRDADLIICMKDGQVVEQGQHDALMTQNGEYRKLYDIQATAYTGASGADDDFESAEDY